MWITWSPLKKWAWRNHESIFQFALNKMKIDKEFVLMVGDNPQMDIEGAQNFGLKTFQVVVS